MRKFRLVTRNDLDGLMCGALLNELGMIDDIVFTNAREVQNNEIAITENDIVANLPYHENAYICFDHHESEQIKNGFKKNFILDTNSDSASRVIFNYYGGSKRFKNISWQMIKEVDSTKGLGISYRDIVEPKKWILLSVILDVRTKLERYVGTELVKPLDSFYIYFIDNIGILEGKKPIEEIIEHEAIYEREVLLNKYSTDFHKQLERLSVTQEDTVIIDFRKEEKIFPGNRFYIFSMTDEEVATAIYINEGTKLNTTSIGVRRNPLLKTLNKHIGLILYNYEGGGNSIAGTCEIPKLQEDKIITDLINELS